MNDPRFPPVRLLEPLPASDNFQHIPPRPLTNGQGRVQRAAGFPAVPQATPAVAPRAQVVNDPHHYVNAITGFNSDAGGNTPALIIPRNDLRRNCLGFRNTAAVGGVNLIIDFGKVPTASSFLLVEPQKIVFFDTSVMQDDVWAFGSAAGWQVAWIYSTIPDN